MRSLLTVALVLAAPLGRAQDVRITEDMMFFEFEANGNFHVIEREQDQEARIDDSFARTSRPCPPFCIHPMEAAPGVETVGELEVLSFLRDHVEPGTGVLIDSRLNDWYDAGTIPGAINLPFTLFNATPENPFVDPLMKKFGGRLRSNGRWDFSQAMELCLFCNGPWCDQSPQAIRNLIALGYPVEKIRYYRGGLQNWLMMGLTTEVPVAAGG